VSQSSKIYTDQILSRTSVPICPASATQQDKHMQRPRLYYAVATTYGIRDEWRKILDVDIKYVLNPDSNSSTCGSSFARFCLWFKSSLADGTESLTGARTGGARTGHGADTPASGMTAPVIVIRSFGFELCVTHFFELFVEVTFTVSRYDTLKEFGRGYTWCSTCGDKFAYGSMELNRIQNH
jgi:hypothetical protein